MTTIPNTRTETEAWLESLGSRFVEVALYLRVEGHMEWQYERHIWDPETLDTTVSMSLERMGGRFAVWQELDLSWTFYDRRTGERKTMPSRAAAEMVAMHTRG